MRKRKTKIKNKNKKEEKKKKRGLAFLRRVELLTFCLFHFTGDRRAFHCPIGTFSFFLLILHLKKSLLYPTDIFFFHFHDIRHKASVFQ